MAANANAANGKLSKTAMSPEAPDPANEGSPQPHAENGSLAGAKSAAAKDEAPDAEDYDVEDYDAEASDDSDPKDAAPDKKPMSPRRLAAIVGLLSVVALMATVGWTGFQAYQAQQTKAQRQMFLQVGRQCALNLTTIDWQHAEGDVQRVLDSATGSFYDDFQQRSQPFIAVVKQAQSKSVGTVTEAGLESESGDEAKVLVAVTVQTSNAGAPDQQPRAWRMRITVKQDGDDAKVSNVEFVP